MATSQDALVSIVLKKLRSIVLDGIEEEASLGEQIEDLIETLLNIQDVLQDADDKQVKNKDVKFWLEEFKDISYDAEDILDEWSTRSLIQNVQHPDLNASVIRKVPSHLFNLFSCFKPIVIQHNIGNKIRELNERLVGVVEKKQLYDLREIRNNEQHRSISSDLVVVDEIYGRDDDKQLILTKLYKSDQDKLDIRVISIVGPSGFGKTILAKLIFEQTKQHREFKFDMHLWVCVSGPFNLEKVAKEIFEQATGKFLDTFGWEKLHDILYDFFRRRRYILVLDDVWSHNNNDLEQLKKALNGGSMISRIIITTRDNTVASMINPRRPHVLRPLSEDACWSLFKSVAFSRMREDDLDKFEDIGKAISKKCRGIPLGTKVLASLMCLKTTEQEWRDVLASHIWDFEEEDKRGILPSILLSYYALPSYLKPCVIYFAVFPIDAIFEKKTLIQLWMAQGYLGSDDDGSGDLEMKGGEYLDKLLMLSFLQNLGRDNKGNITSCRMYDLVHDCVRFISKTDTIVFENEPLFSSIKVRHLSAQDLNWSFISKHKKLRTLSSISTSTNWNRNGKLAIDLLHQLKCLRVVSLQGYQLKELPIEVEQLLQLRYLDLSDNSLLEILPETICNLPNLQTLKMNRCKSLTRLPEGIGMLYSYKLRHVEIEGCEFRPYYSQGCEFRTLDTCFVVVIDAQKNKEECTFGGLELLNHLEGHLKINGLGQVNDNASRFELERKEKIVSLVLDFGWKQEKVDEVARILEALQPHTNLKELVIKHYQGIMLPNWIWSLSNLTALSLMDLNLLQSPVSYPVPDWCIYYPFLEILGDLESLEFLHLHGLSSVKSFGSYFYRLGGRQIMIFPKLKKLILSYMLNLEELDLALEIRCDGEDFFPKLEELIIRDFFPNLGKIKIGWLPGMRKLQGLGKLNCLETLELSRMNGLKSSFLEFMGIPMTTTSDDTSGGGGGKGRVEFPALTNLCLFGMTEWDEQEKEVGGNYNGITIMPRLSKLSIHDCPKLEVIPSYLFSPALRELTIQICPQLGWSQPLFPPLVVKLKLHGDVGYLSESLRPVLRQYTSDHPNINYFEISNSSKSSLHECFDLLRSIRQLVFRNCENLDFMPDDLMHLTMLEQLKITNCPRLARRFSKGDISSSSSHYYKIFIRQEQRESTEIGESSHSDLEKSYPSQSDINVHSGIFCHNCEMYPIDVMRNTPEVLNCYNTPSKNPDLSNCGDS